MHLTSSQMATMKKPKIKSAGEDEEKLEFWCIVGGNIKLYKGKMRK